MKWWDESWNPVTGCTPISEGCKNCYAKRMTDRNLWGYDFTPRFHPGRLEIPLKWKKPRRIFVCSMGDLFHEDIPDDKITAVFTTIENSPHHTFMILTKRPNRMKKYIVPRSPVFVLPNLWLGVTAENQARADDRIPILLDIPAAHRFVSVEPMLDWINFGACKAWHPGIHDFYLKGIDLVIVGGETGPGSRDMHRDWARTIRDQCAESGTPLFVKQMTNKAPIPHDLMIKETP